MKSKVKAKAQSGGYYECSREISLRDLHHRLPHQREGKPLRMLLRNKPYRFSSLVTLSRCQELVVVIHFAVVKKSSSISYLTTCLLQTKPSPPSPKPLRPSSILHRQQTPPLAGRRQGKTRSSFQCHIEHHTVVFDLNM
ncbi:hypothetical protein L1987_02678 [Smallanthus sonchifolius]|uniref:Uncharacterized protein n=1 Tax=Smallanthus sonchifolius TaxID=185202 RepID=A0ACB9K8L5_9ASTR|nr:hypothetical protein L1987_02678 [Smallanthus sonchifolius]